MIRHQAGVKLAVSEQQGFAIGTGRKELGKWTRRWLTDTLDGKDVKSLHLITHCFAFQLGFGPGMALRDVSRERAGAGTTGQERPGQSALELILVCQGRVYCGITDCELSTCSGVAASVSNARPCCPGWGGGQ